jgi:hypothetical protein
MTIILKLILKRKVTIKIEVKLFKESVIMNIILINPTANKKIYNIIIVVLSKEKQSSKIKSSINSKQYKSRINSIMANYIINAYVAHIFN